MKTVLALVVLFGALVACYAQPPDAGTGSTGSATAGGSSSGSGSPVTGGGLKGEGQVCGTRDLAACPGEMYCQLSDHCGASGSGGACWRKPTKFACDKEPILTGDHKEQKVIGCDGKVYKNACYAASAGVSVRHNLNRDSTAAKTDSTTWCGGADNQPCKEHEFCFHPSGNCGSSLSQGVCKPSPKWCGRHIDPVLGCDGTLYNNECDANRAGQDIKPTEGEPCGGELGKACGDDQFCDFSGNPSLVICGEQGTTGVCRSTPTMCGHEDRPVRGCDGKKYANECFAKIHSVSVRGAIADEDGTIGDARGAGSGTGSAPPANGDGRVFHGTSQSPEKPIDGENLAGDFDNHSPYEHEKELECGSPHQLTCPKGHFCQYRTGHCGDKSFTDVGKCVVIPHYCPTPQPGSTPVIGCDGETYPSQCIAAAAGVGIRGDAAKPPAPGKTTASAPAQTMACLDDHNCPQGLICALKYKPAPGQPDAIGECEVPKNPIVHRDNHVLPAGAPCGENIKEYCQPELYCRMDVYSGAKQGACAAVPSQGGPGVPYSSWSHHMPASRAPTTMEQKPLLHGASTP